MTEKIEFDDLSPAAKQFLINLNKSDVEELVAAIEWQRAARTVGRVSKWTVTTFFAVTMGLIAFGEKIAAALKLWSGTTK